MDWILENIWVFVAIAAVIARLLMKAKQSSVEKRNQPAPPKEYEFEDPELAERTRKIREEIQRKVAERRGQHLQPPVLQPQRPAPVPLQRSPEATPPPITLREVIREVMQPRPQPVPASSSRRTMELAAAEEARRQADLLEKLKAAELIKTAGRLRAAIEASASAKESAVIAQTRTAVLDDLRSPQALRRAFVLREVLGPPVALR